MVKKKNLSGRDYVRRSVAAMVVTLGSSGACGEVQPEDIEVLGGTETGPNITGPGDTGEWDGCLYIEEPGHTGMQHMCNGGGTFRVIFDIVGTGSWDEQDKSFSDFFGFGNWATGGDNYASPKIMACCNPLFDKDAPLHLQPHYMACFHDLAENGCYSMWAYLDEAKKDVPLAARPQLKQLKDWLATHMNECYEQFWIASGAAAHVPQHEYDNFVLTHTWHLPSSANTNNIENIRLQAETVSVGSVLLPDNSNDLLTCKSQKDNNDVVLIVADPDDGDISDLWYGHVTLNGPDLITGSADLASTLSDCSLCSILSVKLGSNTTIEAMVLETAYATEVGTRSESLLIDRARISLYAPVEAIAHSSAPGLYSIAPGQALFAVSASAEGAPGIVMVHNQSTIWLQRAIWVETFAETEYYWSVYPFTLEYEDAGEETWQLSFGQLSFRE